jgi:hypothetical protein
MSRLKLSAAVSWNAGEAPASWRRGNQAFAYWAILAGTF